MNEKLGESLSALMDGEASSDDIDRVLDNVEDASLRASWRRYHDAQDSLAGAATAPAVDLSSRIMAAIAEEPALVSEAAVEEAAPVIQPVGRFQRFMAPLASFAVAASVTAAVLLGSQYYGLLDTANPAATVPAASVAQRSVDRGSPVTLLGGSATPAGFGYATPIQPQPTPGQQAEPKAAAELQAETDYDAMARERLRRYMLPHAEESALNTPRGLMPFAKVATFETEE